MSKSRLEWKVGLFVLIGLVLLGLLALQFSKGVTFFKPTYDILLHSGNVNGLKVKATVLMSGVQVGNVSAINLAPDGKSVTITLRIFQEYTIRRDARFLIEQAGFLGDQYVSIVPTKNEKEPYKHLDSAQAEPAFNLQEVARSATGLVERVDETARKLNDSLVDIRKFLLNQQTLTNLSTTVENLRTVSERALVAVDGINAVVATNGPALTQSSSNLVAFSEEIKGFARALNQLVETNRTEVHATVKNIESSSEVLKTLMQDVQAGKGLAGNVLKNEQLANSLSQTVNNLSITTSNLNRLGLWGILWKQKVPKTEAPPRQLSAPKQSF